MQSSSSLPRSTQRSRPPAEARNQSPTSFVRSGNVEDPTGARTSSGSARSQSSRGSTVPDKQVSQIEKSVTHLLVATKQLLETLTQWSRKQASENEVSDVYVRLGYEFNLACRAFSAIGVDTSDLGPVPDLLRTILEDTLSQDASPQSLDRYLPRIRDIIINLLHGLKKKQARLRSRQQREDGRIIPGRQTSTASSASGPAGTTQLHEEFAPPMSPSKRPLGRRYGSSGSIEDPTAMPRSTSANAMSDAQGESHPEREALRREAQNLDAYTTYRTSDGSPVMRATPTTTAAATPAPNSVHYPAPFPPPPPPKHDDAIGALQRSGELERRASRRFSAYQIQKHLGTSSNGVPVLPSQNSPVPNRGRDVRESLNAVRLRAHGRQRPANNRSHEPHHARNAAPQIPPKIPDEIEEDRSKLHVEPPTESIASGSPTTTTTPEDNVRHPSDDGQEPSIGGPPPSLPRGPEVAPLAEPFESAKGPVSGKEPAAPEIPGTPATPQPTHREPSTIVSTPPHQASPFAAEQPSPGKELTLFLQYRSKIKKYILPDGITGLTLGRLQLAFIEKFAWNTHDNGADLPEIYIQDPISGVRHELEDLSDVKDRSVLVLNVDSLDEVRKHFDEGLGGLRSLVESVKGALDGQENVMQRVSDSQLESAKEIARLAAAPRTPVVAEHSKAGEAQKGPISGSGEQISELQSLRRDLAVLRQTYSNFTSDIGTSMGAIRTKATSIKGAAADRSVPSYEGNARRARVESGKKELAGESERLVSRVDDLQDLVEDLRKDVVSRGVRPLPRQLDTVGKDISATIKEIKKMKDFLKREKPIWTKIWEAELQMVCEERDQLTMQEDLAADLEDDVEKASQTFGLVEQATKQQETQTVDGVVLRNTSRNVIIDPAVDPIKAKDDVLGEVRALHPNHEGRLEAIARAERARRKELETRGVGRFQKELGSFVQEGKLKKSGGVEEAERLRRTKDERIRKEVWERQQARAAEMEKAQKEKEAAQSIQAEQQQQQQQEQEPTEAEQVQESSVGSEAAVEGGDAATKDEEKPPAETTQQLQQDQEKEGQTSQESKEGQRTDGEENHDGQANKGNRESQQSQRSQGSQGSQRSRKNRENQLESQEDQTKTTTTTTDDENKKEGEAAKNDNPADPPDM